MTTIRWTIPAAKGAAAALLAGAVLFAAPGLTAHSDDADKAADCPQASPAAGHTGGQMETMPGSDSLVMPRMDPARGRQLFASKGCVACHAVNGVGGHDATALDAHTMKPMMHPFEFAAKMWRMAPFMIAAQEEALGEQILFTGEELAHIIAFVHDDAEQHKFSEDDIPPEVWPMMHHDHGEARGADEHAEELGHGHGHGDDAEEHHD